MWTAIGLTVSAVGNLMMAMPHFVGTGQTYEFDADEAAKMNDKVLISPIWLTGSSKINRAKFSGPCSVRANWLWMGWPFCLAELRREFQTGGIFFCTSLYSIVG